MGTDNHQVALVTGAGSGIGRAVALQQAAAGMSVAVVDIDYESAHQVERACIDAGAPGAAAIRCDVRDESEVQDALQTCQERLGVATHIVANAGIEIARLAHETTLDEWNSVIETNLTGTFLTCRAAIRVLLREQVRGSIVCVSSPSGFVGFAGGANSAYGSSKGGISALVRALAIDYASFGIRVNCVVPGATETPLLGVTTNQNNRNPHRLAETQIPMGRLADPGEIAEAVGWLLSSKASYVTGSHIFVDGGLTARGANDF